MTITEFENAPSEVKVDLLYKYRILNGMRIVNLNVKQEADKFYLWLKMKDDAKIRI